MRPLASTDYRRGHQDVLSVLSVVTDCGEAEWVAQFYAMRAAVGVYYHLVTVDKTTDKIIAIGGLVMERKFLHGLGIVGHMEDGAVARIHQSKGLGFLMLQVITLISENRGAYKTILNCADHNVGT